MSTRHSARAEHGDHPSRWLAVLGAFLVLVAATLPWTGPRAASLLTGTEQAPVAASVADDHAPFVIEPVVSFEPRPLDAVTMQPRPFASPRTAAPNRLIVPELGVNAPVIGIGVTDGVLLPPSDPQTLGWWYQGAKPGAGRGGALITGHTVHTGGGAFDDLDTLEAGDVVRVRTEKGVIGYRVTGVTIYHKGRLARDAERVFSQSVPGRLVLITCEDWNGSGYDSNAIVFAERV